MKIRILGSGTSGGVPVLGCNCAVCKSSDMRDKRLRTSSLVYTDNATILIDCGPDFRSQILALDKFVIPDAILLTHEHYDHVGGIDDLRPSNVFGTLDVYTEKRTAEHIMERLPYCFTEPKYPGVPEMSMHNIIPQEPFTVKGTEIMPLRVMHGKLPILGFVIDKKIGYITDMKTMPEESYKSLKNLDVLIMNALHVRQHPTHQNIEEAIENAKRIGAKRTYFVHMSHYAGLQADADKTLPCGISFAYDGLEITV